MHTELVYTPDGRITGVRQAWAFDDMFSAFATQGLESKEKGKFTREELAPLAKVNVESLKKYEYFTYATADGKKAPMTDPLPDYWLDYADSILTLHFTLPFKMPIKAKELKVEIYDPTIFVDFEFAKQTPVKLVGAAQCKLNVALPPEMTSTQSKALNQIPAYQQHDGLGRTVREQDSRALSLAHVGTRFSIHGLNELTKPQLNSLQGISHNVRSLVRLAATRIAMEGPGVMLGPFSFWRPRTRVA